MPKPSSTFAGLSLHRNCTPAAFGLKAIREKWSNKNRLPLYRYVPYRSNQKLKNFGFYIDGHWDETCPFSRWVWADKVEDARIPHTGWWVDEANDEKVRGIVFLLPHGRCLAGYSFGEHMVTYADLDSIYDSAEDAAQAADSLAERAAEVEQEYRLKERMCEEDC